QDRACLDNHKLYELENILGAGFMRISKSTIINLDQIYGLTRSISDCKIQFHDTYKTVYASRRYYKELRMRLDERRS
ncbi:LytTR family DNA-binding domain-containing protein, partial [Lactobacillus crispatus]|uniref:LytTR family DNA-binding domain-containing protein n=1 Tax=Lactobacillus crispatus TaxID=47770 RepID=UPI0018E33A25